MENIARQCLGLVRLSLVILGLKQEKGFGGGEERHPSLKKLSTFGSLAIFCKSCLDSLVLSSWDLTRGTVSKIGLSITWLLFISKNMLDGLIKSRASQ